VKYWLSLNEKYLFEEKRLKMKRWENIVLILKKFILLGFNRIVLWKKSLKIEKVAWIASAYLKFMKNLNTFLISSDIGQSFMCCFLFNWLKTEKINCIQHWTLRILKLKYIPMCICPVISISLVTSCTVGD